MIRGLLTGSLLAAPLFSVARAELPQVLTLPDAQAYNRQFGTQVTPRFDGARTPTVSDDGLALRIEQFANSATLHWKTFNIGPDNKVEFVQPDATSVALNRVFDVNANPTEILGQLSANGKIYIINRNGILFGRGARVNTHSLVASTLDIDDRVFDETGIAGAIEQDLAAFEAQGAMGDIRIESGAILSTDEGGQLLVFAPSIVNEGTLETPGGQAVLAASQDKVYIARDSKETRGLLVEVDTGGDVTNLGSIIAERGNVSLIGLAVNQSGRVTATTSVNLNGSIRLLARDRATIQPGTPKQLQTARGGTLTLGENSITEVVPDLEAGELAIDGQPQPLSRIELTGQTVAVESGAAVVARGGEITIEATGNPSGNSTTYEDGVSLRIAGDAVLDVSGLDSAVLPIERNILEVEARGNELADAPVQRDGILRNRLLRVDVRKGTPLFDITELKKGIKRGLDERLAAGGHITLKSDGDLVVERGATLNIEGGRVVYTGGDVSTSKFIADGEVIDISEADPGRRYDAIVADLKVEHPKWGVTERYNLSSGYNSFEPGYIEGKDAGILTLDGSRTVFAGELRAGSVAGIHQRLAPVDGQEGAGRPFDQRPLSGMLDINAQLRRVILGSTAVPSGVPARGENIAADAALVVSRDLIHGSGLSRLKVSNSVTDGSIELVAESPLLLPENATLDLQADSILIASDIVTPGGDISLRAERSDLDVPATGIEIAEGVVLDVSGLWTNDNVLLDGALHDAPIVTDGGSIRLSASQQDILLGRNSVLDAGGGIYRDEKGRITAGKGGEIELSVSGNDINFEQFLDLRGELRAYALEQGGSLKISADAVTLSDLAGVTQQSGRGLNRFSPLFFEQGGFSSYSLTAVRNGLAVDPGTHIAPRQKNYVLDVGEELQASGNDIRTFTTRAVLPEEYARPVDLGLKSLDKLDQGAVLQIAEGASITLQPGGRAEISADTSLFIDGSVSARAGAINLTLAAKSNKPFDPAQMIWLGTGATLDASGSLVSRFNPFGLQVGDVLDAGQITFRARRGTVVAAPGSLLDVHGVAADLNLVGDSGRFSLSGGNEQTTRVNGAAGRITVSAAEGMYLDGTLNGRAAGTTGRAGELALTLDPRNRSSGSVLQDLQNPDVSTRFPRGPRVMQLGGTAAAAPGRGEAAADNGYAYVPLEAFRNGGFDVLDLTVLSSARTPNAVPDTLDSTAEIRFVGDVALTAARRVTLDAPVISSAPASRQDGTTRDDSLVNIDTAYLALGTTEDRFRYDGVVPDFELATGSTTPLRVGPRAGSGNLVARAEFIEFVGDSVFQGFGNTNPAGPPALDFISRGDIRLRGTRIDTGTVISGSLRASGDVRFQAERIYPTTLTQFDVRLEGQPGATVEFSGGPSADDALLSAAGVLNVIAPNILQSGVLRAPLGSINLQAGETLTLAEGSLTSVSAQGSRIPFGRVQFGTDLVFPFDSATTLVLDTPLDKTVDLAGPVIDVRDGAVVEISGGGAAVASEFVKGPGGSRDILAALDESGKTSDAFAVLPALGGQFAPFDPLETPFAGLTPGETIYLEGTDNLPAGEYAILPARYALFGGYLVTPVKGTGDLAPGLGTSRVDGIPVVAGKKRFAGTEIEESRWSGYSVMDGEQVRLRAEYIETPLDTLFADAGARLNRDAGRLSINAQQSLRLAGSLAAATGTGRGSQVDITANILSVVNSRSANPDSVELLAGDLNQFGADSLLLGGTRTRRHDVIQVGTAADRLTVADGVSLQMPEVILTARDALAIGQGGVEATTIRATGNLLPETETYRLDSDSAFALVSTRPDAVAVRAPGTTGSTARLDVAQNARLESGGSLVLDSSGDLNMAGQLNAAGASLALGARAISLGELDTANVSAGLRLSNATLARMANSRLRLRSNGGIDVYGAIQDAQGNSINFERLAFDAAGIVRRGPQADDVIFNAGTIEFANRSEVRLPSPVDPGSDSLRANADTLTLGEGEFQVAGFSGLDAGVGQRLVATGPGSLDVTGDVTLAAPVIRADKAADYRVEAVNGRMSVTRRAGTPGTDAPGVGGKLTLAGATVDFGGRVEMPSGLFTLQAKTGDLDIARGAEIDLAGIDIPFLEDVVVSTDGGQLGLVAGAGNITIDAARLDVSGAAEGGNAGVMDIQAPQGGVAFSGAADLSGLSGRNDSGRFLIDAAGIRSLDGADGTNDLGALNAVLAGKGFQAQQFMRLRKGDIEVAAADTFRARDVTLIADAGALRMDGSIDASGADGGFVVLAAADGIDLNGSIDAHATDAEGDGGRVELHAIDNNNTGGTVNFNTGASIDVRGGAQGKGGDVALRVRRVDTDADGVTDTVRVGALDGTVIGARRADIQAVRTVSDSVLDTNDVDATTGRRYADMDAFVNAVSDQDFGAFRLMPELEILSDGDLVLNAPWDLGNGWRFGPDRDLPGVLTLRAAGNLVFNASLSDGFASTVLFGRATDTLSTGASWDYRLVAGADTSGAYVLGTTRDAGEIRLAGGTRVRTGTGRIDIAAGGNLELGEVDRDINVLPGERAAIYTAGRNAGVGAIAEVSPAIETLLKLLTNNGQFPTAGGDIRIDIGGDLLAPAIDAPIDTATLPAGFAEADLKNLLPGVWQPRFAGENSAIGRSDIYPTFQAIAFERFSNGVAALGGGNVDVRVAGDVANLVFAVPTTGKAAADGFDVDAASVIRATGKAPLVNGGGDITVRAGGNYSGGLIHIDRGVASIDVGGALASGTGRVQPLVSLGDAQVYLSARDDIRIERAFNPGIIKNSASQYALADLLLSRSGGVPLGAFDTGYFSYTDRSAVSLTSLTGNAELVNSSTALPDLIDVSRLSGEEKALARVYPPSVRVLSVQQDAVLNTDSSAALTLFPSPTGSLEVLAGGSVLGQGTWVHADADAAFLPSAADPALPGRVVDALRLPAAALGFDENAPIHADSPVHAGDDGLNLLVARSGDVSMLADAPQANRLKLRFAGQTVISAGRDVKDLEVRIQHVAPGDVSLVRAGGDIVQSAVRGGDGRFRPNDRVYEIAGPGRLDMLAGGSIDLGTSVGVVSVGDIKNPVLADAGAGVTLVAGLGQGDDLDGFIAAYVAQEDAAQLAQLPEYKKRGRVYDLFFATLLDTGVAATDPDSASFTDYSEGFLAIDTLFPDASVNPQGELRLLISGVSTLDGGDINLLVPGGLINAGATSRSGIDKSPDELGIVTGRAGNVNVFSEGDFLVNQSRAFALNGDLLIWSNSNIDAGRGAKTAISAPPPVTRIDDFGNTVTEAPPSISGSGLLGVNAFLFAPQGIIDAGDAGIRADGNLTLGATRVLGADNINVGGVSVGVPAADTGGLGAGVLGVSNVANNATRVGEASTADAGEQDAPADAVETGILSVEVIGFGDDSDDEES